MTTSQTGGRYARRLIFLAVFIVALFAGYAGLWYYLAGEVKARSEMVLANLSLNSVAADCEDMQVRGFPFRLGVFCDSVTAVSEVDSSQLSAGAFRTAAQVYNPNHIISELDSPVTIVSPRGDRADFEWRSLQSSTVFGLNGLDRASVHVEDSKAVMTDGADDVSLATDTSEFHTRQNGDNLDFAAMLRNARLATEAGDAPAFDLDFDVSVDDRAWLLSGKQQTQDYPWIGASGSLKNFVLALDNGARIAVQGPFSIDQRGLLDGRFDLSIRDLAGVMELARGVPDPTGAIENVRSVLSTLSGTGEIKLPVTVRRGKVSIAFFTLGRIPPLRPRRY